MEPVTNPQTAIRRFEKNKVREITKTQFDNGFTIYVSHIKGQPGVRERRWNVQHGKIMSCEITNPEDRKKNEKKIQKFIRRWNDG